MSHRGRIAAILLMLASQFAFEPSGDATAGRLQSCTVDYSSNCAGAVFIQFDPNEVRMKFDKLGLTVITKGPQWNAVAFSDTTKSYMDMTYAQWKEKFSSGSFAGHKTKLLKGGKSKVETTGKSKKIQGVKADEVVVTRDNFKMDVWLASSITPPKQVIELMNNMLDVPVDKGLPLSVTQIRADKPPMSVLDLNRIDTKPIPKDVFQVPKGLKKVKDEMALMIDESDFDVITNPKARTAGSGNGAIKSADKFPPKESASSSKAPAKPGWFH